MPSTRTSLLIGAVLLCAAPALFFLGPVVGAPGLLGPAAVVAIAVGFALTTFGVVRMAATRPLIILGALWQLGGVTLFHTTREPTLLTAAVVVATVGFWLLLTGVIAAGVKLASRELHARGHAGRG